MAATTTTTTTAATAAATVATPAAGCFDLACFVLVFELWSVFDIGPKIQLGQGRCVRGPNNAPYLVAARHLRLMHLDFHGDGHGKRLSKRGTNVIGHFH